MAPSSATRPITRWLLPATLPGKWSAGLLAGSLGLFGAFFALVMSGQRGGDTFAGNLWLSGTIVPAAGLALAAGAVGLVAAIKDGERSLVVGAAIAFGLLVALVVIGEIVFPH